MSLSHAFKFYNLFKQDPNFRKACYACKSREEWFVFSDSEFEEVISSTLFRCLMEAIETITKERQCSRIMLEVREDNMVA
ncbi:MAG: hypothetical protein BGO34_19575 [Bacteroidia bacterium 44-10]|nr:MAG: hypothetical protein BGO34_19575 [Bacteroidia bacterium 44-10]